MTDQDHRDVAGARPPDEGGLPSLAPADASDDERGAAIEARMFARFGAPTVEHYRRVYVSAGLAWPGDDEIRRTYVVTESSGSAADPAA